MANKAEQMARAARAGKAHVKVMPNWFFIPLFVMPWILFIALWAGVHYGIFYPKTYDFCRLATKTPTRIMCSDPSRCSIEALYLTGASMNTNNLAVGFCGHDLPEAPMYLPDAVMFPDEVTQSEMLAEIGAMRRAEKRRLLKETFEAQGGPQ